MLNTIECTVDSDVEDSLTKEVVVGLKESLERELEVLRREASKHKTEHRLYAFFEKIDIHARGGDKRRIAYVHFRLRVVFFEGTEDNGAETRSFCESYSKPISQYCDQEHALGGIYVGLAQDLEHLYTIFEPED